MKHLTYGEKGVFIGDEAANVLLDYAAVLADSGRSDTVELNAVGPDGHLVRASYLLDPGATLMAETADDEAFQEPDNTEAVAYMLDRLSGMTRPRQPVPVSPEELAQMEQSYTDDLP